MTRTMPPVIVIGFVGGFIKHDNLVHSEVQLAARLRKAYPSVWMWRPLRVTAGKEPERNPESAGHEP